MEFVHTEHHYINRVGWLRAAVLGANDGIVSVSSLIVGVAAAMAGHAEVITAGVAGLVAGALSMAAGEYVSVSSQADTEKADLEKERIELERKPEFELEELTQIFVGRGLTRDLAEQVAVQLTEEDALAAHAREEMGISEITTARPLQAAFVSAITFAIGAGIPLIIAYFVPLNVVIGAVIVSSLCLLAILGGLGAYVGGAPIWKGVVRILFWGAVAMAVTAGVGYVFGITI